jgi:hypothetical protein
VRTHVGERAQARTCVGGRAVTGERAHGQVRARAGKRACMCFRACLDDFWIMFGLHLGYIWAMFGACLEHVWTMFGPCLGFVWAMLGLCLGHLSCHVMAMFLPCLDSVLTRGWFIRTGVLVVCPCRWGALVSDRDQDPFQQTREAVKVKSAVQPRTYETAACHFGEC